MPRNMALAFVLVLLLTVGATGGHAAIIHTDSIAWETPNWDHTLTVPQYDPSFAPLSHITIEFWGYMDGDLYYENLSTTAGSVVNAKRSGIRTLYRWNDNVTILATLTPEVTVPEQTLPVFDGNLDYAGPSGRTFNDLYDSQYWAVTLTDPGDLAEFVGTGNMLFRNTADALNTFSASGGTVTSYFENLAASEIRVAYHAVPEPGAVVLFGVGLAAVGLLRRMRRKVS